MIKRYENALQDLLDTVANEGFATEKKWKIVNWYGQTNFTVAIRRDIREKWESLIDDFDWEENVPLLVAETKGGNIILMQKTVFWDENE